MEWIPTQVGTQHKSFVPNQYQPGGGLKEWERHVDVKTPLRPYILSLKPIFSPVKGAQNQRRRRGWGGQTSLGQKPKYKFFTPNIIYHFFQNPRTLGQPLLGEKYVNRKKENEIKTSWG